MARESKNRARFWNWRVSVAVAALALGTASAAMATLKVRRFVSTDPQFTLSPESPDALRIEGLRHAPRAKVLRIFSADFDRSIYLIPLQERRRELLAIDWVEDASVSRLWPDRLVVRLRERTPIAFVSLRNGVRLIDAYGTLLQPPAQAAFAFPVLSGIRETDTPDQRLVRVRAFRRVEQDMGYLARDVSEVDTSDPDNIRVVAQAGNQALDLILGDSDFGRRYQNFLNHYAEIRKRSPDATRFDLRLDDRITAEQ